jgi:Tfp pilus assembly protein PilF
MQEQENGEMELKGALVYGLHAWAMLEQRLGNWSKARELLERAANVQPGNAVVHQTRALLEARAHNYAAARFHFRLAVEAAPEDVKCWQAWALFEARQSKPTRMRQLFQRALQAEPNNLHSLQVCICLLNLMMN